MPHLFLAMLACQPNANGLLTGPNDALQIWPGGAITGVWSFQITGEGALTLEGASIGEGPFEVGDVSSGEKLVGETIEIEVAYTPEALGEDDTTLTISTDVGDFSTDIEGVAGYPIYFQAGAETQAVSEDGGFTFKDTIGLDDFAFGSIIAVWTFGDLPAEELELILSDTELIEVEWDTIEGWVTDEQTETLSRSLFLQPETETAGDFSVSLTIQDLSAATVAETTIEWSVD